MNTASSQVEVGLPCLEKMETIKSIVLGLGLLPLNRWPLGSARVLTWHHKEWEWGPIG
jgi:hypothetical protein